MAELLDRGFQREILQCAAATYPAAADMQPFRGDDRRLRVNIAYLHEHGLIHGVYPGNHGRRASPIGAVITAKGIDFLADDGGLSAILGVITIKLHEDTLKSLIASKIQESEIPQAEKKRYLDQLRELPGETTKHLALKLVDAGLENWHKALPLLQNILFPT
ncbi:hypothetical protein [Stenotrophomonas sp. YAU14D1_LEIMI4_1]|uniref:hypothetical protein n=1 Tax=Stenotrophomonas sp. YAU14D1_LEIMI4_1 TaxID=2072407 RepID=UPI000D53DF91|nr:hypothetical protein [Stenotrophomonas sp. YAU14D1_LEIMI4_1]AWH25751.1 hypothetical protein C1932_11960 [Stenotrophomonas sp. YAU14D1_LEIMI4_1]